MSEGIMDAPVIEDTTGSPDVEPVGKAVTDAIVSDKNAELNKTFLGTLPEELRGHTSLKNIKGTSDLATQFVNQQSLIGSSLRVPTDDSSTEQKEEFYKKLDEVPGVVRIPADDADEGVYREFLTKLGVPGTPDEYKVVVPEGQTFEDGYLKRTTQRAFDLGLNNNQLNKIIADEIADEKALDISNQEYIEASKVTLKSIWSQDYNNRVAGAINAMRVYKEEMPEAAIELEQVANNPLFIKILSDLGEHLNEQGHAGMQSGGNYGMSVDDAKMKMSEIRGNPDHVFHKGDEEAVNYMLKLNEILAGASEQ